MRDTYADTSLARTDLGFAPKVSLEQGLEAEYRWLSTLPARRMTRARARSGSAVPARRATGVGAAWRWRWAAGCSGAAKKPPAGTPEPDKFLFERGTEQLNRKHWLTAREYFRQLVDSYPQSRYRADAKLGVGDTYLGEHSSESFVLAAQRVPGVPDVLPDPRARRLRAVQAGHDASSTRCTAPERDQTETREAIKELTAFVERYPRDKSIDEGRARLREARDRLSQAEYRVGYFYWKSRWYPGAIDRFKSILASDPEFTNRDAVYFHLADSLAKIKRPAEALPLLREADQGIRDERVPRRSKQAHRRR